jgi:MerR family transcriptional regulator, copper efflux regulator
MPSMNIGDAAAAAGVTPKMIRHYEALGLIPEADRTDAGYRLYGEREVAMLRFIRQSRGLGFSTRQIESLLALWRDGGRQSREVKEVALQQLAELEERQREIDQMRSTLQQLVARCPGDNGAHCAILDSLARGAAPAATAAMPPSKPGLKHVAPGTRRPAATARRPAAPLAAPAHAGLVAWTRSLATV